MRGQEIPGVDRRRLLRVLAPLAVVQGLLVLAQAELVVRALAPPDAGPLPWLAGTVALRAGLSWATAQYARRTAADAKADLRSSLLHARGGPTLIVKGLDALDPYLTGYLPQLAVAAIVPPLILVRLLTADVAAGLTVLVTLPLVPVFGILVGWYTRDATRLQWERLNRLGGHFRDVVAGMSTLRAFDRLRHQEAEVGRMAEAHRLATRRVLRVAFLSALVLELVATLSVALVAVPVGLRLLDGGIDYRTALLVLLLTPEVYLPLRALGSRFHAAAEGLAVAEEAARVIGNPGTEPAGRRPATRGVEIRLENVTVRYGERLALDNVSLVVRPGEVVALTGPSGAGKSTLLAVILGLVSPDDGRILVDGADLSDLDGAAWRRRIAWVPQAPHLFAESVANNVRLGAPDSSEDAVQNALLAARAETFVKELPQGRDTVLGERGAGLSAGERQRIALARAYLRDAPILLLDEPTARLDPTSENAVVHAARRLLLGRTAVLVAHRPALLQAAERVVRLRDGRILEEVRS
ncbi:thiol reductant ABC exporter subunit CydD [Actinomadura alba]|uniref:Thiol reductant ABC exporter subunit CydD n=1 Tax=Actinomadura alba TaxID=406431 RepID=A0ABR7LU30_9ACTN|nr:thiol reductant ABC exporter subunit CydD [Actinomadura alba]MBC6468353.1 thiol reductant ABC exporter subunit CydD [Actinomadura alba]